MIRIVHVDAERIHLANLHIQEPVGSLSAVVRHTDPAVTARHESVLVLRIPPDAAEVPEGALHEVHRPGLAAIFRLEHRVAGDDDMLVVERVDLELVERVRRFAAGHVHVAAHLAPRLATVIGAIQLVPDDALSERARGVHGPVAASRGIRLRVLILDQRVEDAGVALVDIEADAADLAAGQAVGQTRPLLPAVVAPVNTAFWAALDDLPRQTFLVVHSGKDLVRRLLVDHHVDGADAVVDEEHLLPGHPAIL